MRRVTPQAGFTLIEILVVIVIVGIMVAVTMLSPGLLRDDREVRTEATRFVALYEIALDEAILQGRDYGIEILLGGYRFVEFDPFNNVWVPLIGDDTLSARQIPEDYEFVLYIEDTRIVLEEVAAELDDPEELELRGIAERYSPHLLVFSSGDTTPFDLNVVRLSDEASVAMSGDALGGIEFVEGDE